MRVYHFLEKKWALDDISRRRLRISTLPGLNDPFELMSWALPSPKQRRRANAWIDQMGKSYGILCFSKAWTNPVMWSHYAHKHTGICLGFDIPTAKLKKVSYVKSRLKSLLLNESPNAKSEFNGMQKLLFSKYIHWKYEAEWRIWARLEDIDGDDYFAPFSEDLRLRQVIVGPNSNTSRAEIAQALGSISNVKTFKARLAFNSFKVVRNQMQSLWE